MGYDDDGDSPWAGPGSHRVTVAEFGEWAAVGGHRIAVVARYPDPHPAGPVPVIVLCHGLGGDHRGYAGLGTRLASHGYAVLHPRFPDSPGVAFPELTQDDPRLRDLIRPMLFDPAHWVSRVACVHAIVDSLAGQTRLPIRLDAGAVLVAGHSYGAYTAQLLLGTKLSGAGLDGEDFAHPAVAGGILLSPQGSGDRGLTHRSWRSVESPLLVVTGTRDTGARGEGLSWRREVFDRAPSRFKHLAIVRGGDHFLGGIPDPGTGFLAGTGAAVSAVTVAFACHVHGDRAAGAWLAAGPFPTTFEHAHREEPACPMS
ncbi:alpha/beta hydrolase family protein [Amycolatopsis alkalitolerans]|uniref:alpha/beta hydrolase family protein n=1 Tax=Amycolatopsis alkalitolerans TaxID=2547244 RepID=UPI0013568FE0|nr:hypothetical protein [Amycolatopsis alkalitolerans]